LSRVQPTRIRKAHAYAPTNFRCTAAFDSQKLGVIKTSQGRASQPGYFYIYAIYVLSEDRVIKPYLSVQIVQMFDSNPVS